MWSSRWHPSFSIASLHSHHDPDLCRQYASCWHYWGNLHTHTHTHTEREHIKWQNNIVIIFVLTNTAQCNTTTHALKVNPGACMHHISLYLCFFSWAWSSERRNVKTRERRRRTHKEQRIACVILINQSLEDFYLKRIMKFYNRQIHVPPYIYYK